MQSRISEGYFGPTASYDRSPAFQNRFEFTSLPHIVQEIKNCHNLLNGSARDVITVQSGDKTEKELPWTKDLALRQLEQEWPEVPKGGEEELRWMEKAVALSVAGFEDFQRRQGIRDFTMRDNQIYYLTALLLGKGQYSFGKLETDKRGIELPTGEGKTYCFGVASAIAALQGKHVVIMEPSYVSALNHSRQMAGYYESFFHQSVGVAVAVPEKEGSVRKLVPDEHGIFTEREIKTMGFKSYRYTNGEPVEEPGKEGRRKAWNQKIVYIDQESLPFDRLEDHQIGVKPASGQPPLPGMSVFVAEADALMLDNARNPFITSEVVKGKESWSEIESLAGFEKLFPEGTPENVRQTVEQRLIFSLWANLFEAKRGGFFKEGFGKSGDYLIVDHQFIEGERMVFKAYSKMVESFMYDFGYDTEDGERRLHSFLNSWGALDLQDKSRVGDAVEQIRAAYRFTEKSSEEKLKKILSQDLPKELLAGRILQALRQDHYTAVVQAATELLYYRETEAGERPLEPDTVDQLDRKSLEALVSSWGFLDVREPSGYESALRQLHQAYRFNRKESEGKLRRLFDKDLPRNLLLPRMIDILEEDHQTAVLEDEVNRKLGFLSPANRKVFQDMARWLDDNSGVLDAALHALFGMQQQVNFIGQEKPVLLDEYGLPLEKRQLQDLRQVFLQLHHIWQKEGMADGYPAPGKLDELMLKYAPTIEISRTVSRTTLPALLEQCGEVRFSSGSLIPAASSFSDLYGAEVLAVGRHLDIPASITERSGEQQDRSARAVIRQDFGLQLQKNELDRVWKDVVRLADQKAAVTGKTVENTFSYLSPKNRQALADLFRFTNAHLDLADVALESLFGERVRRWHPERTMLTKCLDGGLATVKYLPSEEGRLVDLERRADEIREAGKMGLFIVQDIETAKKLMARIPGAELATGDEELKERGTLDKITSSGEPGKVIITTWIAHRDIDVKMTPEIEKNGGLDCVVSGIAPTERGLWQALQRALRGDMPGTRTLLLTHNDFNPLLNRDVTASPSATLIHRPAERVHAERSRTFNRELQSALEGDQKVMYKLFRDYLGYLRNKEEGMKRQLLQTMIRDSDLDGWRQMYVTGLGRFTQEAQDYMQEVKQLADKIVAPLPSAATLLTVLPTGMQRAQQEAVMRRMEAWLGYSGSAATMLQPVIEKIKEEDLRSGWADFLRFLDLDASIFLTDPEVQKLTPNERRAKFRDHIDRLLAAKPAEQTN